ncbi:unnamed protein product [Orchesella dallaii]|uniref:Protein kinase domain-containing protein n=1 Tax=Orchesella dallaii TaxID=48710 RepID=A0ABP1RYB7_9HEXA
MENLERETITANMDKLTKTTICSVSLLAKLLALKLLSDEDIEDLKALEAKPTAQAFKLYNIVITRKNGFEKLIEGLRDTEQSGALSILAPNSDCLGDITTISYDETQVLGRGGFGTIVYKGKLGDRDVAVKRVPSDVLGIQAVREVDVLKACDGHENIVRYFGIKVRPDSVLILLELCDLTLSDWIEKKSIDIEPVEILKQITMGLDWLHCHSILHRDLKPENILMIQKLKRVKISDFGLSRCIPRGKSHVSMSNIGIGTQGWVAPEILEQILQGDAPQSKFTFASDVFALGCIYYYVLSDGKHAFGDYFRCQANILDGKPTTDGKDLLYVCAQNILFIKLMISHDPKLRPACSSLLSCPLFWPRSGHLRFLEHLKAQFEGGIVAEKVLRSKSSETCHLDHCEEINVLNTLGFPLEQTAGCVVPEAYLHCRNIEASMEQYAEASRGFNFEVTTAVSSVNSPQLARARLSTKMIRFLENLKKKQSLDGKIPSLFEIIKTEPLSTIQLILEEVSNISKITDIKCDENEKTMLHAAVGYCAYDVVEYLMTSQGFSDVLAEEKFNNLVHTCIWDIHVISSSKFEEKIKILQLLLDVRPDSIDCANERKQSPLHAGTSREFENGLQYKFVEILTQNNADCNVMDSEGKTPLHLAVDRNPLPENVLEIIKHLVENYANPDAVDSNGHTCLHLSTYNLQSPTLFHGLVEYLDCIGRTKSFSGVNTSGITILQSAVQNLELLNETLDIFKKNRVDFNAISKGGESVVFHAIRGGRSDSVLKKLFELGADWRIRDVKENDTAFHYAARHDNLSAVKLFISLGCDVNARNNYMDTVLHVPFYKPGKNVHDITRLLMTQNVDTRAINKSVSNHYRTAWHIANQRVTEKALEQRTLDLIK